MTSIYMGLNLPVPTVTIGPEWATELNTALDTIDAHDHSSGKGTKVKTNGLNIDDDLSLNIHSLTDVISIKYEDQITALTGIPNVQSTYTVNGDLYYTNGNGAAVQLTTGNTLVPTVTTFTTLETQAVNTNIVIGFSDTYVFLEVDTTSPRTITLPEAIDADDGRFYIIKDVSGLALTNPITVDTVGANTIDGDSTYVINSAYGSAMFVNNGVDNWSLA